MYTIAAIITIVRFQSSRGIYFVPQRDIMAKNQFIPPIRGLINSSPTEKCSHVRSIVSPHYYC